MEFRISFSNLWLYSSCAAKFYYEHCLGLFPQPSIHLLKGHIVHEILEKLPAKMTWSRISDAVSKETDLRDRLNDLASEIMFEWYTQDEMIEFCKEFCNHPKEPSFDEMMEDIAWNIDGFIWWYVRQFFTFIRAGKTPYQAWKYTTPDETEHKILEDTDWFITREDATDGIPDSPDDIKIPIKLKGYIDATTNLARGSDIYKKNTTGLIDYKTSKIFKFPITEEYMFQLYFYAYLWNQKFGEIPTYGMVHYLRSMYPTVVMIPDNVLDLVEKKIQYFINGIQTRHYPGNPSYQWCQSKYCDWWKVCKSDGRYSGEKIKGDCDPDFLR